jgi:hypothetical protein
MTTERPGLDYYAYGKYPPNVEIKHFNNNISVKDKANNLLERNALSLNSNNLENIRNNYKSLHSVNDSLKANNNYLAPLTNYRLSEQYKLQPDMTNIGTYNIVKSKYFAK